MKSVNKKVDPGAISEFSELWNIRTTATSANKDREMNEKKYKKKKLNKDIAVLYVAVVQIYAREERKHLLKRNEAWLYE